MIGTDRDVDRRLSAVAEVQTPYYPGLTLGVPGVLAMVEAIADGRYDLVHVCTPGPVGVLPASPPRPSGSHSSAATTPNWAPTQRCEPGAPSSACSMNGGLRAFYGACARVLSPSPASDAALAELGVGADRVLRWDRGVDLSRFGPELATPMPLPGEVNVLYAGRLAAEKGIDLLAEAFLAARERDPRLHLVLAGVGPGGG